MARASVEANTGDGGAFGDVTSSPRALAFSADGRLAFVADTGSEDVLVIDATNRVEATVIRPPSGSLARGRRLG